MGVIDDIGTIPLKIATEWFKKGYFIYIIIILGIVLYWILSK